MNGKTRSHEEAVKKEKLGTKEQEIKTSNNKRGSDKLERSEKKRGRLTKNKAKLATRKEHESDEYRFGLVSKERGRGGEVTSGGGRERRALMINKGECQASLAKTKEKCGWSVEVSVGE